MKLYIGTSGYSYKEWKGNFYPENISADEMLSYYAKQFSTVELNNTFYRLPKQEVFENQASEVPSDFRFSVKVPRRITHIKRLKDTKENVEYLFKVLAPFKKKFEVILVQLPPNFKKDMKRLEDFIKDLPDNINTAFEFRHPSWFEPEVYDLLKNYKCTLCLSDTDEAPVSELINTSSWGYLRLRGSSYTKNELSKWMKKIEMQNWEKVFIYFKHEDEGKGAKFAQELIKISGK